MYRLMAIQAVMRDYAAAVATAWALDHGLTRSRA